MRTALVQMDVAWLDPEANFATVRAMLDGLDLPAGSLIVLPEMFATGFCLTPAETAPHADDIECFLHELAAAGQWTVLGGLVERVGDSRVVNLALLTGRDVDRPRRFEKLHPLRAAGEDRVHWPGRDVGFARVGEWILSAPVCYDLRFPEAFRRVLRRGVDLFAIPANWPAERAEHWRALLIARAIENQAYVLGCNRCGSDPNWSFAGGSLIVGPKGEILAEAGSDPCVLIADLDHAAVAAWREQFPAIGDMRDW